MNAENRNEESNDIVFETFVWVATVEKGFNAETLRTINTYKVCRTEADAIQWATDEAYDERGDKAYYIEKMNLAEVLEMTLNRSQRS